MRRPCAGRPPPRTQSAPRLRPPTAPALLPSAAPRPRASWPFSTGAQSRRRYRPSAEVVQQGP
eukprot:9282434-Alexandrium_andersonii.AAC.1